MTISAPTPTRDLLRYRTIDLVTIATLGVAFGVVFWAWNKAYEPLSDLAVFAFPPSTAVMAGVWLTAGVVGGLVVRKPGAALATETIAAAVSLIVIGGNQWGMSTLASGLLQGLGVEIALALFLYRRFTLVVAALGGLFAAVLEAFYEWSSYYPDWDLGYRLAHLGFFGVSGVVIAGIGGWFLVRALARTGVLDSFAAGREQAVEV